MWLLFLALQLFCLPVSYAQQTVTAERFSMGVYFPSIKNLVSRTDFEVALNFWIQEVSQIIAFQAVNAQLFDNIADMNAAFERNELDFVLAPPILLAKYFDRAKLTDGFVGTAVSGNDLDMLVLVRKEQQIHDLKGLRGKRLLLTAEDDLADILLDTLTLKTFGRHYPQVFSNVMLKDKQNAIVLGLFFNQADVGAVYAQAYHVMAELNPQLEENLQVLYRFPTRSPNYGFFSSDYPKPVIEKIIAVISRLNEKAQSKKVLNDLLMGRLVPCPVAELTAFDRLLQEHQVFTKRESGMRH